MSVSTVVQLARFNATQFASNSEWVTDLKEPIILNQGDQVVVSKVYLDSRLSTSNNIVIPIDTEISLTYYFYYMLPPDCASIQAPPNADLVVDKQIEREENPDNLGLWTKPFTSNNPLQLYQGNFFTTPAGYTMSTLTGIPEAPYVNYIKDPEVKVDINQSYAVNMPLLLTTNTGNVNTSTPYTKTWRYVLKAGSYAPDELAELITKSMAQIQPYDETNANYTSFQQFGTSQPTNLNAFLTRGSFIDVINTEVVTSPSGTTIPLLNPFENDDGFGGISYSGVLTSGLQFSSNDTTPAQSNLGYVFSNFLTDVDIPKPFLSNELKTTNTTNNPITITPIKYVAQYSLTTTPYDEEGGVAIGQDYIMYTSPLIGCNEPSLEYNDTTGVFQFTYLHTPLLELPTAGSAEAQQSSSPIEVVKIVKTINIDMSSNSVPLTYTSGNVNICERTKHSGIIFQSMNPPEFWQNILGFDVPNITFTPEQIFGANRTMDLQTFNRVTTSGYVGIQSDYNFNPNATTDKGNQNLNNKNKPAYTSAFPLNQTPTNAGDMTYTELLNSSRWFLENYILQNPQAPSGFITNPFPFSAVFNNYYEEYASNSIATNPLTAISVPLSNLNNTGHYLVEIVAYGHDKDFINNETIYQIKEIVSSYYVSENSFITSPFPSSFIYNHVGETMSISSYKCRIIDPITMDSADNLGASSSIYIQVNKQLTEQSIPQPD
jgi:hypothetical protein